SLRARALPGPRRRQPGRARRGGHPGRLRGAPPDGRRPPRADGGRMTLALRRLIDGGVPSPEAIDRFLADHRVPVVEGTTVTFLYRGKADAVYLQHWIYGLPSAVPFTLVSGTDLWYLVQE